MRWWIRQMSCFTLTLSKSGAMSCAISRNTCKRCCRTSCGRQVSHPHLEPIVWPCPLWRVPLHFCRARPLVSTRTCSRCRCTDIVSPPSFKCSPVIWISSRSPVDSHGLLPPPCLSGTESQASGGQQQPCTRTVAEKISLKISLPLYCAQRQQPQPADWRTHTPSLASSRCVLSVCVCMCVCVYVCVCTQCRSATPDAGVKGWKR